MKKEINALATELKKFNASIFVGDNYIQIYKLGTMFFQEFEGIMKKYKKLDRHTGINCIVVEEK